jgi:DNA-binding CsgD family transcriptional regulator
MVMVRSECLPVAGTLPLLPVASALGELARLGGGDLMAAALSAAPGFVRAEAGRLVPQLGPGGGPGPDERGGGWQRGRLFAAVAQLLGAVAEGSAAAVGLVVEDVHWADSETLDCLTFLGQAGRPGAVRVVVTCRGDEAPLAPRVAGWLAQVRGAAGAEEITLGPLSRAEVARQAAALVGGPVPPGVVDELFARAEGNPFFTEQLIAAALADGTAGGGWAMPAALPGRLAGVLAARAGRCAGEARAVLDALAVAGRPLGEDMLGDITGLETKVVRRGLRELAAARLLADDTTPGGAHRPRHALLAEAVAADLLPGERAMLHERTARALAAAGGEALAGEAAGHWQAASRPGEELPARVAAAESAERVFGYAEAAGHWLRAIELCPAAADATGTAGIAVPQMYVRAIDALDRSGDSVRAGRVAEEAYHRFAGDPDQANAAVICQRAAQFRAIESPADGLPLIKQALQLFGQAPPSAEHAKAWYDYAESFLRVAEGRIDDHRRALRRALEIAEAARATTVIPRILALLAEDALLRGHVEEGLAFLRRGQALAQATADRRALVHLAVADSDAQLKLAQFHDAAEAAVRGLETAGLAGLADSWGAKILAANAADALVALGHTGEAAAVIDPLTPEPPDRDNWVVHEMRAEIDLLRGNVGAAEQRQQLLGGLTARIGGEDLAREAGQRAAEFALWAGRPGDALAEVQQVLPRYTAPDLTILCGRLLAAGMRACADLAGQARARRDALAAEGAVAAAEGLVGWVERMGGAPFTEHPFVATIPAERATWDAERARVAGDTDPAAWAAAAKTWDGLGCPHRAAYAWWRQAQAHLDAGQPPTIAAAALRAAAAGAGGHQPLLDQIRLLAERARIPLDAPAATAGTPGPYGLTGRELAVLRLVAAGRSNAQIGAELFISPRTAGVHVTNILRKLGVTNRVQAAALAERAGLLDTPQP